jgi:hypothetical protein
MKVLGHPSAHSAKGGEEVRDTLVRIVVGGMVVSVFALLGDLLKPKSFAGLFGAAPSVALATLVLTVRQHGITYASIEGALHDLRGDGLFLICLSSEPAHDSKEMARIADRVGSIAALARYSTGIVMGYC